MVFIDEVWERVEGLWSFQNGDWNFKSKCLVWSQSIEMEKSEKMDGIVHERVVPTSRSLFDGGVCCLG